MPRTNFAGRLLRWWDRHGRKDLPWQRPRNCYRIWVSEIMLQQTQVTTVIPYFQRFMQQFPSLKRLAEAPLDNVLACWSGLGYYARGRNLHRAAQLIRQRHKGRFPDQIEDLMALPGIGRSTAGAILALARNQPHAILDGNVKRVFCRHGAIPGRPGQAAVEKQLWQLAQQHLASDRCADYTQALMDLGATCCLPRNPRCGDCPVRGDCQALARDQVQCFPEIKSRTPLPVRKTVFVIARDRAGQVLLEQRPARGIWGGLWCFPEAPSIAQARRLCRTRLGLRIQRHQALAEIRHTFSHFQLHITPLLLHTEAAAQAVLEGELQLWYNLAQAPALGLAAPVSRLLDTLKEAHTT